MIEITDIEKNFGEVKVLKGITLSINEGEIYGLIGHSGAGKSTLLRCINGLESYNLGSVKVMGNHSLPTSLYRNPRINCFSRESVKQVSRVSKVSRMYLSIFPRRRDGTP